MLNVVQALRDCEGGAYGVAQVPLECAPGLFGHFQIPSFFHMFVQIDSLVVHFLFSQELLHRYNRQGRR